MRTVLNRTDADGVRLGTDGVQNKTDAGHFSEVVAIMRVVAIMMVLPIKVVAVVIRVMRWLS